ncbi:hypothetical protein M23134_01450 [Microscilla marina ATCC 23134]|uniref:Uncharacterized protein n=1 Tax=Microscilla marina ATCC 23134 TaxID=313606 RepID=A1ZJU1_MICM2|nr:hypothetical protein M23134_00917 [Microscilla marina ATCC 23134]EAY23911.1 hypothetical protein M23134_00920 [Microscilla marina ATCC 23134]EAY24508.1 hypothetical protein M23134_06250 [Microscilla marina ATCC 23134]EAY25169.1 hypothetical protein M23134_06765 [Microscilla marina ATCC 23134]EAY25737.1 hypothetical protein M23134_04911 [Microscilla marina ATCC 23134]
MVQIGSMIPLMVESLDRDFTPLKRILHVYNLLSNPLFTQ